MNKTTTNFLISVALVLAGAISVGCANLNDYEQTKALAQEAKAIGERALIAATNAQRTAEAANAAAQRAIAISTEASRVATEAQGNAVAAQNTAHDALQCCEKMTEKLNRAFKKSLEK